MEHPRKEDYESALKQVVDSLNVSPGTLIHPIRLAVSGMGTGPGLYEILGILGKEEVVRRLNKAIESLS